ncbi:hypothetical protein CP990_28480, partial [Escherichia coli]
EMWLGYNIDNWMFELNGIYKFADNEDLYNINDSMAEAFPLSYRIYPP